ncbi:hypothetical protein HA402_003412 [Bradysia odoriphaga]|nr:hypothetical protein HA402_003412 [Bradysia odoriphaga]
MACSTEIKLESKFDTSVESNADDTENQPSTWTSQSSYFDSDSDAGETVDVTSSQPVEVVDIDTSEDEEEVSISHMPRKAGLRQLTNIKSFKESDSDDSDEGETKRTKFTDPEKVYNVLDEPCKLLKKLQKNRFDADVILEKYVRCTIDGGALSRRKLYDLEMEALREILERHGNIIERLSLNKFYWEETKVLCNYSPFNIYAVLTKLCKNLRVLMFSGPFGSLKVLKSPSKPISLHNLREIYYTCGDMETAAGDNRDVVLHTIYLQIFNGATSLERLEYTFFHLNEANQIFKAMRDATAEQPLKFFKRLKFISTKEDVVLEEEQISTLSLIKTPNLEHLEFGNGIWQDVKGATFEKMLSNFRKLQTLIMHGSRLGDPSSAKSDLVINFPRMDKLSTLSMGAEYEFESVIQTSTSTVLAVNESTTELRKFQIRLQHTPNLRSIILGNLINIDELTFKNFPNLEVFKVGGQWNTTCNFLQEPPHRKITDLQFPDALKDSSLSSRIPKMFPALRKLWIYLPSVFCLRGFFEAMSEAKHVRIEELHLKTQFDFESTLESCLLGRSTASLRSQQDKRNLELLKRYSHFEDYVRHYNIELPIVKDEQNEEDFSSPGIGVLKSLKVLQMEHIPRILRIPTGAFHWLDYRCVLTNDFIGYRRYPLSQKCINELHVKSMHTFVWPNFEFTGSTRKFVQNGLSGYTSAGEASSSQRRVCNAKRKKLHVTIQPSMLRPKEYKIKAERS